MIESSKTTLSLGLDEIVESLPICFFLVVHLILGSLNGAMLVGLHSACVLLHK